MNNEQALNYVVSGYLEAIYFTETGADEDNQAPQDSTLTDESRAQAVTDCQGFLNRIWNTLLNNDLFNPETLQQIGHDFWLTRNGHGVGFWDRSDTEYGTEKVRDYFNDETKRYAEVEVAFYGTKIDDVVRYESRQAIGAYSIYDNLEGRILAGIYASDPVDELCKLNSTFKEKLFRMTEGR